MASDINKRLNQLRARRNGSDRMAMDESVRREILSKSLYPTLEPWEKRSNVNQPYTRYALGAMQPVSETYTRVSIDTADRVANQLKNRLTKAGFDAEFRLQGSVPLDVHIRRVSDVDLLAIDTSFLNYMTAGVKAQSGFYSPTNKTSSGVLKKLRAQVESDLVTAFPEAKVDISGAKAVKLSGGSLPRSVDVVPAHWLDTIEYQSSGLEHDRGIIIYNNSTDQTIENLPFLHIKRIETRCKSIDGGLRKAIRLCKNVKADEDYDINLSSFDIASTMYHANMSALERGRVYELAILAETQYFLDFLVCNQSYAKTLLVPDGSRNIFDSHEKIEGLTLLSINIDSLLTNVYEENALGVTNKRLFPEMRKTLQSMSI